MSKSFGPMASYGDIGGAFSASQGQQHFVPSFMEVPAGENDPEEQERQFGSCPDVKNAAGGGNNNNSKKSGGKFYSAMQKLKNVTKLTKRFKNPPEAQAEETQQKNNDRDNDLDNVRK